MAAVGRTPQSTGPGLAFLAPAGDREHSTSASCDSSVHLYQRRGLRLLKTGIRPTTLCFLACLVIGVSLFAFGRAAHAGGVDIKLDLTELAKLAWDVWKSTSAESKKRVQVDDIVREMNILVGQREAFLPQLERYVEARASDPAAVARLRSAAVAMLETARRLEAVVKKIDPAFAMAHSEVHIQATGAAASRGIYSLETVRVFYSDGRNIDYRDLIRRLRAGTCDLRQVIRNLRSAAGQPPGALTQRDMDCGVK